MTNRTTHTVRGHLMRTYYTDPSSYQVLAAAQAARYARHQEALGVAAFGRRLRAGAVVVLRLAPAAPPVDYTARENARRRAKTAERRTKNHQAATLAWWGPLPARRTPC